MKNIASSLMTTYLINVLFSALSHFRHSSICLSGHQFFVYALNFSILEWNLILMLHIKLPSKIQFQYSFTKHLLCNSEVYIDYVYMQKLWAFHNRDKIHLLKKVDRTFRPLVLKLCDNITTKIMKQIYLSSPSPPTWCMVTAGTQIVSQPL